MIWHTLIDIVVFSLILWGYRKIFPCKPILYNDEWNTFDELPEKLNCEFIITDGERVKTRYDMSYDKFGRPIYDYAGTEATHWRYLPKPPKKG